MELTLDEGMKLIEGCKNAKLLEQMDKWLRERLIEEEDRRKILEGKAAGILAVVGISASLTTGLGLSTLPKLAEAHLAHGWVVTLGLIVVGTAALGTLAAVWALRTLLVADAHTSSDRAVVDAGSIEYYSAAEHVEKDPVGYRVIRVRDLFRLLREGKPHVDAKAGRVGCAQKLFVAFVVGTFVTMLAFLLAFLLNSEVTMSGNKNTGGATDSSAPTTPTPSPPTPAAPPAGPPIAPPQPLQPLKKGDA